VLMKGHVKGDEGKRRDTNENEGKRRVDAKGKLNRLTRMKTKGNDE